MNSFLISAIQLIANMILGTGILERVKVEVDAWAEKEIDGLEKKEGVFNALKAEGLFLTQRAFDHAVQLALMWATLEKK